jgi:hypothetical protein
MKKLLVLLLFSIYSYSQVGIGTTIPQGSLDINSTSQGLVPPRLSLTATNLQAPCVNPQGGIIPDGTIVYNTNTTTGVNGVVPGLYTWVTNKWISNIGIVSVNANSTQLSNVYEYSGIIVLAAGTGLWNINISALGFTSILNVQLTAEKTTTDIRLIPLVSMTASPTTTNVSFAIVESKQIVAASQGLELSTGACNIHITIKGTK